VEPLSERLEGELRGLRRLRVSRHLARCARCYAKLESLARLVQALRPLRSRQAASARSVTSRHSRGSEKGVEPMAAVEPRPVKEDRDEVFLEYTKSICPVCKTVIDAEVNVRGNRVILRKRCREHGLFEALVYSDAELYLAQQRFNKPGTIPLEFQTEVADGCPLDCGLCPEHKQHACLGIIEVNTACNLDCPICFADSGHQPDGYSLTLEKVEFMLDRFVAAEGSPEVVQFSGGEPTIHPQILDFIALAGTKGIRVVMLNTNGIRIARDPRFAHELGRLKPHVYLQFDGFELETHLAIRGTDLRADKQRALARCAEEGLTVTLVCAVEKNVNEHELGAIVRFGVAHPAVNSVAFQPVTHSGRHLEFDPLERLTNADVIKLVAVQVPEWFHLDDFVSVPYCFPSCRSMSYAFVDGETVVPFTRLLEIEDYLDYVSNRIYPDKQVRAALERMFSSSATPGPSAHCSPARAAASTSPASSTSSSRTCSRWSCRTSRTPTPSTSGS
jgi:7,8-dihydro-6-hydroxymethylpterin dimethyltransferase